MKLLLLLIPAFLFSKDIRYWEHMFQEFSVQQRSAIVKTFVRAMKDDLSFSMAAIHFKESQGSKYKFNINTATSIDVGDFMVNTKEYNRKLQRKNNTWNTARAMEELEDPDINFNEALNNFKYCLKAAKGDYKTAYRYYNGWKSGSKRSYNYSEDVYNIRKVLEKYFDHTSIRRTE